jgi:hypothetical protein
MNADKPTTLARTWTCDQCLPVNVATPAGVQARAAAKLARSAPAKALRVSDREANRQPWSAVG